VSALPHRSNQRFAGSLVTTSFIAEPQPCHLLASSFASAALHRPPIAAELGLPCHPPSAGLRRLCLKQLLALEPGPSRFRRMSANIPGENHSLRQSKNLNRPFRASRSTASPADRKRQATVASSAWNTCISQSMINRVWLTLRNPPTKASFQPAFSLITRSLPSPQPHGVQSHASYPTTASLPSRRYARRFTVASKSSTCGPTQYPKAQRQSRALRSNIIALGA